MPVFFRLFPGCEENARSALIKGNCAVTNHFLTKWYDLINNETLSVGQQLVPRTLGLSLNMHTYIIPHEVGVCTGG